ncbi:hypothetical protein [Microseira sp. BLCC-F43]|jgi:hypothetical protein|uniref:hypothetical protein n=1 Tax=Microseira sp. BLCC-F43 TaxID=3153602 RepID=UPI0035B8F6E9
MHRIIITAQTDDNSLDVNLSNILQLIQPLASNSQWDISELDCSGSSADELQQLADAKTRVSGTDLLRLATNLTPLLDGLFSGYFEGKNQPWISIRAADNVGYELQTENQEVLARMRQNFKNVTDMTYFTPEEIMVQYLKEWAQAQIDQTAQPEVRPDIAIIVLQLVDKFEALKNRLKELEEI